MYKTVFKDFLVPWGPIVLERVMLHVQSPKSFPPFNLGKYHHWYENISERSTRTNFTAWKQLCLQKDRETHNIIDEGLQNFCFCIKIGQNYFVFSIFIILVITCTVTILHSCLISHVCTIKHYHIQLFIEQ